MSACTVAGLRIDRNAGWLRSKLGLYECGGKKYFASTCTSAKACSFWAWPRQINFPDYVRIFDATIVPSPVKDILI